uniref:Uncharacterized protein n=1 Tax=Kwoniella bestiolae CBS 10118 TaxID=1296100 RepID=A0A1B9FT18_9TREE|nr:hypothetical protein I302_08700 [Kwoniella bestiolae CBS 10118]OCF21921.1 hypothetical protein I302_08700 [Kwoniella bestiolae CBS 10118]
MVNNTIPANTRSIMKNHKENDWIGPQQLFWPRDPDEIIQDTDVIFNMTISTLAQPGDVFEMEQLLESPYIAPTGNTTYQEMLQKGIVVCPEGECVAQDCTNTTVPTYDVEDFHLTPDMTTTSEESGESPHPSEKG